MTVTEMVQLLQPPKSNDAEYKKRYESIIEFVVGKVETEASIYTNIPKNELPESLNHTLAAIASSLIESFVLVNDEVAKADADIKQISEGDTSVTYVDAQSRLVQAMATSGITASHYAALNQVRRVVF